MRIPSLRFILRPLLNRWVLALWLPVCLLMALVCGVKLYLARSLRLDRAAWVVMDEQTDRVGREMNQFFYLSEAEVRARLTPGQQLRIINRGDADEPTDFYLFDRILRLSDPTTTDFFFIGIKKGIVRSCGYDTSSRTESHLWLHNAWDGFADRLGNSVCQFMGMTVPLRSIPCTIMGCWLIALVTMLAMWQWHRPVGQIALALALLAIFATILETDPKAPSLLKPRALRDGYVLISLGMLLLSVGGLIAPARRRRTDGHPHCPKCGYDLTGNESGICPECGNPVPEAVHRHQAARLDVIADDEEIAAEDDQPEQDQADKQT